MKDIDFLEILFRYIYKNGEVLYYERAFRESGIEDDKINLQLLFRLHELIKSTGLVEDTNKRVGNHPSGVRLNKDGYQMMLKYGSYKAYLESTKKDEDVEKNEGKERKKLRKTLEIVLAIIGLIASIITILQWLN